jgi:hypothetical protein
LLLYANIYIINMLEHKFWHNVWEFMP